MENSEVWIFPEGSEKGLNAKTAGLIAAALDAAGKCKGRVGACVLGHQTDQTVSGLSHAGVERVCVVDSPLLAEYSLDAYVFVLERLIEKYAPALFMFAASPIGSELATRLAARSKCRCITHVNRLNMDGDHWLVSKSAHNDKVTIHQTQTDRQTMVLTIEDEDGAAEAKDNGGDVEVIREAVEIQPDRIRTRNMRFLKGDPATIDIVEAERIIAVGDGLRAQDLPLVQDLAARLGAAVGATRPVIDKGMLPFERQIGITGKSVRPDLLLTCAVSGAREFTAGVTQTHLSIAVNTDKKAPIFKTADIGIVGNAVQIIDALLKKLKTSVEN